MAVFRFEAMDSGGQKENGVVEADSPRQARAVLRSRGLVPLSLPAAGSARGAGHRFSGRRIAGSDRVLFIRQLASLLASGIPLDEALAAVAGESDQSLVRERLLELRSDVLGGSTLSMAMDRHSGDFPPVYRALVAAGEKSGRLGWVLERLADYSEARDHLRQKVIMAMAYPAIVSTVALCIVIFLMTTVVPQVVSVFINNHQALPLLTRIMIALSGFIRHWGWALLLLLAFSAWGARKLLARPGTRLAWDAWLLTLPLLGKLIRGYNTERFSGTLAILVGGGVPILPAIQGAANTLGNRQLQQDVEEALVMVREGSTLSRALGATGRFPPVLLQLVHAGESTGRLPEMLERVAQGEASLLERRILLLTALLEPALILLMGLVVALIVLAVLLPIMEINQMVR